MNRPLWAAAILGLALRLLFSLGYWTHQPLTRDFALVGGLAIGPTWWDSSVVRGDLGFTFSGEIGATIRLYEMLRPGADRQAPRRTRTAALEIAKQRLQAVKDALLTGPPDEIPHVEDRVRVTNPQFAPTGDEGGGKVMVTVVAKKSQ